MSRSSRHTAISGWASCGSQKLWRSMENRSFRHRVRHLLTSGKYDSLPHVKEYGNEWASPRDGKMWFGNIYSSKYRCTFCISPHKWHTNNKCYCEEFRQQYKELMRK